MKRFFVSSVFRGMERNRAAAVSAIEALGHSAIDAERYGARPDSPRVACLQGVREADGLILILGDRYGEMQPSGKSATHEEYEAASNKPVFVFVDESCSPDPDQNKFLMTVQDWRSGRYTSKFTDTASLRDGVTRALHEWMLSQSAGSFDEAEASARAVECLPVEDRGFSTGKTTLAVSIASGPKQSILRPSELEASPLANFVKKSLLFGDRAIFNTEQGIKQKLEGHTLLFRQGVSSVSLDELGSIVVIRELTEGSSGIYAVIQEEVSDKVATSIKFAMSLLDHIDDSHKLTHSVAGVALLGGGHRTWRSRAEHLASPNSATINMRGNDGGPILLQPPSRPRRSLEGQAGTLGEDFTVLLRRSLTQ